MDSIALAGVLMVTLGSLWVFLGNFWLPALMTRWAGIVPMIGGMSAFLYASWQLGRL